MAMTGGQVRASVSVTAKGTYPPPGIASADPLRDVRLTQTAAVEVTPLTFGTGSGRINRTTVSDRAIAPGSSVTWDLFTGTDLPDLIGLGAAFREVRFVMISVLDGGDESGVRVGGAASDEWVGFFAAAGDRRDIFPGGPPFLDGSPAGVAVGSTTKNLKVENRSATEAVQVRVVVSGSVHAPGSPAGWLLFWTHP